MVYPFPNGTSPSNLGEGPTQLTVGVDGTLYGIGGEGLFSLQTNGVYTLLHQFASGQGTAIGQGILLGSDGSLYGLDSNGIYKLSNNVLAPLVAGISSSSLVDGKRHVMWRRQCLVRQRCHVGQRDYYFVVRGNLYLRDDLQRRRRLRERNGDRQSDGAGRPDQR